jgi:hypothetical protein
MKKILLFNCTLLLSLFVMAQTTGDYQSFATGNWNNPATWERFDGASFVAASTAPASTDGIITIRTGHNITVNSAVTADQVVINAGGTLTQTADFSLANGAGDDLVVNGTYDLQANMLAGPGNVLLQAGSQMTISTASEKQLQNATITNNGSINWEEGNIRFDAPNSALINNGTFIISGNNTSFFNGGRLSVTNNGTFTKTSTGTSNVAGILLFSNAGTLNCNGGNFVFGDVNSGGTFTNAGSLVFSTGTISIGSGCIYNHNAGSSISGSGSFANTGTANFNISQIFPSTISLSSTGNIAGAGDLIINSLLTIQGNITGSGLLNIKAAATWNGGTLARNVLIDAGQSLTIATATEKQLQNAAITNNGNIDWQNGNIRFDAPNSALINNGTFIISGNNTSFFNGGRLSITNNGTVTKTSTGTSNVAGILLFSNAGTLNCNGGHFLFGDVNSGGTFTNAGSLVFSNGTFSIGPGCIYNHNAGSAISGSGSFANTGTANFNISQTFPSTIALSSTGNIAGAGDLILNTPFTIQGNVTGGGLLNIKAAATWIGGTLARNLLIDAGQSLTIATASEKQLQNAAITNNSNIDWQNGNIRFDAPNSTLINNGTFIISGNNTSFFNGGRLSITNNGTFTKTSTGTSNVAGILLFSNAGTLNCNGGNFVFGDVNSGGTFTNLTAGTVILSNGDFTNAAPTTFNNNSGAGIKGNGVFNFPSVFNNNGIMAPGLSPGLLTINGLEPLSANSNLQIEMLNGSGAGTGHDQLIRSGNLTLGGTLTVTAIGSVPVGTYTIINLTTGTITGSFATVNIPSGTSLLVNSANVQLIVSTVLPFKLISFTGSKQNNDALLQWKTANEINVSRFEVQRSENGFDFITIGSVAAGSGLYSFADVNTFITKHVVFYRLKSIDADTRFTYSNIIKLNKQASAALTVYPNPVCDVLTITGLKQNGTISLFNAEGKLLLQQTVSAQTITVDMSGCAKGMYLLKYYEDEKMVIQKIIKQ